MENIKPKRYETTSYDYIICPWCEKNIINNISISIDHRMLCPYCKNALLIFETTKYTVSPVEYQEVWFV